jgi:uncharacterized protein with NAD-binding domain and iron-sulfur cluster
VAKIAILGGGPAGLAAAFELSDPALAERHEISVYEMSWRLGGKCASGRNAERSQRIEEHGLHIWFGFYNNAFELLDRALRERCAGGLHPDEPWTCAGDAFSPLDHVTLCSEREQDAWVSKTWRFPPGPGEIGEYEDMTFAAIVRRALSFVKHPLAPEASGPTAPAVAHTIDAALAIVDDDIGPFEAALLRALMIALRSGAGVIPDAFEDANDYAEALDIVATIVIGLISDGLYRHDADWANSNDEELCDWLERHGSGVGGAAEIAQTPVVRALYQLCFAYHDGDRERPDLAAGKALQALLRLVFGYRKQVMWKMNSGMGDTVFTPLYDALSARGVRFEFFHRVSDLQVRDGALAGITLTQTHTPSDAAQDPLVQVGLLRCWPSKPKDALDFDPELELPATPVAVHQLQAGRDFDHAVLAIPVGALPAICADVVAANPRFGAMLDAVPTVATQALQVWYAALPKGAGDGEEIIGSFAAPLDTYSGMEQIAATEGFALGEIAHVAYFCGVMPEPGAQTHAEATARAHDDGLELLDRHAHWLGLLDDDDEDARWNALYDPENRSGVARFEAQYWRANTEGSHRYTLTPAGSVSARLRPDESGIARLTLAGDWTRNGICGGSVEAAVTSGRLAARAIDAHVPAVRGVDGWLERD